MNFSPLYVPGPFDLFARRDPRLDFLCSELALSPLFTDPAGPDAPAMPSGVEPGYQGLEIVRYIRPQDLEPAPGLPSVPLPEGYSHLYYSFLICRGFDVILAGPLVYINGNAKYTVSRQGILPALDPVCDSSVLDQRQLTAQVLDALRSWRQTAEKPMTVWNFRYSPILPHSWRTFAARGLLDRTRCAPVSYLDSRFCLPTPFGRAQGVGECGYTNAGYPLCTRKLREQVERPPEFSPDWEPLPLKTRLERLADGRACNPGHYAAVLKKLGDMPLEIYLKRCPADLKRLTSDDSSGLSPYHTVRDAALEIERRLRNRGDKVQVYRMIRSLYAPISQAYRIRKKDEDEARSR